MMLHSTCFFAAFGWIGVPMLSMFLVSALWSCVLAVIQCAPTQVANYLMGTGVFDFGEFWLLPHPDPRISIPSAVALAVFAAGYCGLALLMVAPPGFLDRRATIVADSSRVQPLPIPQSSSSALSVMGVSSIALWSWPRPASPTEPKNTQEPSLPERWLSGAIATRTKSSIHVVKHNLDSPILALPKLIFQTTTLIVYLHEGFPVELIVSYSTMLFINWSIACYRIQREYESSRHLVATQIFSGFDLFFAVFAPLHVLVYAYYSFSFERDVFMTRVETLTADSFSLTARLFADPTEISLFRIAFQHLQLSSVPDIVIKCSLNAFTIAKWRLIIKQLRLQEESHASETVNLKLPEPSRNRWKSARRWFLVAVFFGSGLCIFIHSLVALSTSHQVCKAYTQCRVPRYQWNVGATHCSCIVFVDRETKLTTMAKWEDPPDVRASLAALAFTGHLKIIQIINRQLPALPEELLKCTELKQLILIYTKIKTIPDWANEFRKLEYLHIEGDLTKKQLLSMPQHLFVNMDHMMFLHLGCHLELPALPELNHLVRLEYLALAMLHSITVIPPIDRLVNLKRLSIIDDIRLLALPSVGTLRYLNAFELIHRLPVCCNGYLPRGCNLLEWSCMNRTSQGEPLVQCSSDHIPPEDYKALVNSEGAICPPNLLFDLKDMAPTFASTDLSCGGVQFKQCTINGAAGICYHARMMPVSCQLDQEYIKMRRLQIQRKVGDKCDPLEEEWLGCVES